MLENGKVTHPHGLEEVMWYGENWTSICKIIQLDLSLLPWTKVNKMYQRPQQETQNYESVMESIGDNLHSTGIERIF